MLSAAFPEASTWELFHNVTPLPVATWCYLDEFTRFMILPDGTFPSIDTCALFEYKGTDPVITLGVSL